MIKTKKIYAFIQSAQLADALMREQIANWFALVRLSFTPTSYYLNQKEIHSYDIAEVRSLLEGSIDEVNFELILTDGQNESSIHVVQEAVLQRHLLHLMFSGIARTITELYKDHNGTRRSL